MRFGVIVFVLGVLAPVVVVAQQAASPQIMVDVKSGNFTDAQSLAAATGDPLMLKLVDFFRLTAGGGTADELQDFMAASPDWPEQGMLAFRLAEAQGVRGGVAPVGEPVFLQQVESLHEAGNDDGAAGLLIAQGRAAMGQANAAQRLMFWPVQDRVARALLMTGDAMTAYRVVTATDLPVVGVVARGQIADRDFFAGFLQLRFLKNPVLAAAWFNDLLTASVAVITQARGYYWLARTEAGSVAAADYERAAAYPDTYYGQLASLALGETSAQLSARILSAGEPAFTAGDAVGFGLQELPRAAALLAQMGDNQDAGIFLSRVGVVAADDRTRELAAKLALGLGIAQSAVAIARTAGVAGQMLVREGWPVAESPPAVLESSVALGIMRQESSFDPMAVSGAGADGLMQLMPATARRTAAENGLQDDNLFDPGQNMALGSAYLAGLIQQFGNCLPLAVAAYNAGPQNVANWVGENGDPEMRGGPGGADMIDWVEEIPFNETRNYVQRVTESIVVYRALQMGRADDPLTPWLVAAPGATALVGGSPQG